MNKKLTFTTAVLAGLMLGIWCVDETGEIIKLEVEE